MPERQPITLAEAARRSGLTHIALRQAAQRGSLTATKIGRDWITTPEDVDEYLRNRVSWKNDGRMPTRDDDSGRPA